MKKLILILALLTLNSYAIDCLRANFEIHKMTNYKDGVVKGMVIDSVYLEYRDPQHSTEFDHSKYYWTGDQLDSAIAYQKKHNSNEWEITVQRTADSSTYPSHRTITEEGKFIKIITTGGNPNIEELIYQEKDSVNHVTKYVDPKTGEVTNTYLSVYVLRNDTIHESENNGHDSRIIVRDSVNENKCYEKNAWNDFKDIEAIHEYEMRGDTLVETETRPGGYQSTFKVFFVPISKYSSAMDRRTRLVYARPKAKPFDLLGRPAKNGHSIKVLK